MALSCNCYACREHRLRDYIRDNPGKAVPPQLRLGKLVVKRDTQLHYDTVGQRDLALHKGALIQ